MGSENMVEKSQLIEFPDEYPQMVITHQIMHEQDIRTSTRAYQHVQTLHLIWVFGEAFAPEQFIGAEKMHRLNNTGPCGQKSIRYRVHFVQNFDVPETSSCLLQHYLPWMNMASMCEELEHNALKYI